MSKKFECYMNIHILAYVKHESPADLVALQERIREVVAGLPLEEPDIQFSFSDLVACGEEGECPSPQAPCGLDPSGFQAG